MFADTIVSPEEREAILAATLRSPTAGNMMLYHIIEVESQSTKARLAETCDHQPFIAKAPMVWVFCADYQRWYDYFEACDVRTMCKERGIEFTTPVEGDLFIAACDALVAAQTSVIAAESIGLASCYVGDIMENYEEHVELLGLPPWVMPMTMVVFGHPPARRDGAPRRMPRFDASFVLSKDRYHRRSRSEFDRMADPIVKALFKKRTFFDNTANLGQHYYARKMAAPFTKEMSRSVRAAIRRWCGGNT